jgi:uncharacterized protein (TIGR02145 family)
MKKVHAICTAFFVCCFLFTNCKKEKKDSNDDQGNGSHQTFLVSFNPNGGEGSFESQTFVKNIYQELKANTFTHTDSVFIGWNKNADGSGNYYINRQKIAVSSHTELHAQWANPEGNGQPCPSTPTVSDLDGNIYQTVQIGSQCWMRDNLKTTHYKTGENIPVILDKEQWINNNTGAMCFYNNDAINADIFGALYNGYAVKTGNLCPEGWHVPSDTEWNMLAQVLEGSEKAGYKMKALYYWFENNANNESSFSAYPAGMRSGFDEGRYYAMGDVAAFWSATHISNETLSKKLIWNKREFENNYYYNCIGLSVRCLKN